MSYLARLAAQSGLVAATPLAAQVPGGIEIVNERIEVTAPPLSAAQDPQPPMDLAPPPGTSPDPAALPTSPIIEEVEVVVPAAPTPPQKASVTQDDPVATAPEASDAAPKQPPAAPPTPEEARDIQFRQVLEWVSRNDAPEEPLPEERPTPQPSTAKPSATLLPPQPAPATPQPPPSLEIGAAEQAAPEVLAPQPSPPAPAAPPAQPHTETAQPSEPRHIVEERIEISIGAIHLDVAPPRMATRAPAPMPPAPAPAPRAPDPCPASRLARRFIRT